MSPDERRSAALLFGEELALGTVDPAALRTEVVHDAVRARPVPSWASRRLQRRMVEGGGLDYLENSVAPMVAARRAVLGDAADGPPRFLVRLGAFPEGTASPRALEAACAIFAEAEVPVLVAVAPRPGGRAVEQEEEDALRRIRFTTSTVFGLQLDATSADEKAVAALEDALRPLGIAPDVVVPAGGALPRRRWLDLHQRFAVICSDPRSVATMGWHPGPLWRGEAVHLPVHEPFWGGAAQMLEPVARIAEQRPALWIPLAIDWAVETPEDLRALAVALRGLAHPWEEFLSAVRASSIAT